MRPPATRPRVAMGSVAMWFAVLMPAATRPARPCTAQKTLRFLSGFSQETFSKHSANVHRTPIEHSGSSRGGEGYKIPAPRTANNFHG